VAYEPGGAGSTSIPAPDSLVVSSHVSARPLSTHSSLVTQTTLLTHASNFPDRSTRPLPRQNTYLAAQAEDAARRERFFVLGGSAGAKGFRDLPPRIDARWTGEQQRAHAERAERSLTATQSHARKLLQQGGLFSPGAELAQQQQALLDAPTAVLQLGPASSQQQQQPQLRLTQGDAAEERSQQQEQFALQSEPSPDAY
jgi:hypothetical protein